MAQGFIDHASISSAIAALKFRDAKRLSPWDRQCLTDATYMLLFHNVGIVPGPSDFRGASGLFTQVISTLPSLVSGRLKTANALRSTKMWMTRSQSTIQGIWLAAQSDRDSVVWAALMRELFWVDHVRMHGALFDLELLSYTASLLQCSPDDLRRVHNRSRSEATVRAWLKTVHSSPEASLANDAYMLAILLRGRFHEYVAADSGLHLAGHPFRNLVRRPLGPATPEPVSNSEDYFVRVIVGSALLETTDERRVSRWVENIKKARDALAVHRIALPHTAIDSDAETLAAEAAKRAGISTTYARLLRELDAAAALGIGGLLLVSISPWLGLAAPFVPQAYRHLRGLSIGEDLSRTFLDTTRRFARLAHRTAGRVDRTVNLLA